jgi:hypothetical protein
LDAAIELRRYRKASAMSSALSSKVRTMTSVRDRWPVAIVGVGLLLSLTWAAVLVWLVLRLLFG